MTKRIHLNICGMSCVQCQTKIENALNAVMIVPDYGIQHAFDYGENVIEFTPTEPGLVRYSCWMGMVYGSINVIE